MRNYLALGILLAGGVAYAAIVGTVPSISQPAAFEVLEGATQQLTLGPFTREDGKTAITPATVAYRIDCLPPSSSPTSSSTVLLATQHPAPATTVTTVIPSWAIRACPGNGDAQITVDWTWLPGQCSSTVTTSCSVNGDCPGGETCRVSTGSREALIRTKKRKFSS